MRTPTCERFGFHCQHWGLTDAEQALVHMQIRRMDEVYAQDIAAGHTVGTGSELSVRDDGPRLRELLADEGFEVVPR